MHANMVNFEQNSFSVPPFFSFLLVFEKRYVFWGLFNGAFLSCRNAFFSCPCLFAPLAGVSSTALISRGDSSASCTSQFHPGIDSFINPVPALKALSSVAVSTGLPISPAFALKAQSARGVSAGAQCGIQLLCKVIVVEREEQSPGN